jgi:hypothetical protein
VTVYRAGNCHGCLWGGVQSADAVRNARAAWLRAAHAWDQMTTDAPKVISRVTPTHELLAVLQTELDEPVVSRASRSHLRRLLGTALKPLRSGSQRPR